MEVNPRFDSSTASREESAFKRTFSNGQKGNLTKCNSDRSTSFREGSANTLQGSSTSSGDSDPLAQSSKLDQITTEGPKHTRSGELRPVLGMSFRNTLEDCALRTANLKSPFPVATEELKRFRACIQEASAKARDGSKKLDESLHKLNKCWEAVTSKKQFQNELLPNERMSWSHLSKMGSQTHQSPTEVANQRLEDRPKNVILNKRIRTSAAEIQVKGKNNSFGRQPSEIGKDRDNIKDGGKVCDVVKDKVERLPASGETWDGKTKRKRSMGTVSAGSIDAEGELKGLRSSGHCSSIIKLHVASLPASSNSCVSAKNEQEKVSKDSMNGSNKERAVLKRDKFDVHDKNYTGAIYPPTKGEASREPQTGSLIVGNSSSAFHSSKTLEVSDQPSNVNKPINHKRTFPAGSSISHMPQWVGQKPQKISRTRRSNVVSPVLNCDEMHVPLEGCSPSDVGTRMTSTTPSGPLISKGAINSIQLGIEKNENDLSLTRLSESEYDNGENGESKLKEKGLDRNKVDGGAVNNFSNISSYISVTKKKKMSNKEEIGNGLHSQCDGSSNFSVLKTGLSSPEEKLEILTSTKPIQKMKPSSEKKASRSRRPRMKKSHNSNAITHLVHPSTRNSPDVAGRSGDDHEELLFATNLASNASYIGCSSSFWKKMEPNFAPVNLEVIASLKQLVKPTEDDQRFSSDAPDEVVLTGNLLPQSPLEGARERIILNQTDSKELSTMVDMVDQHHNGSFLCSEPDSENKLTPLYQRVLTALIIDDQTEETAGDGNTSFLCEIGDSPLAASFSRDFKNQFSINRTEHEFNTDLVSSNENATFTCGKNIHVQEIDKDNLNFDKMCMEDRLLLELQSVGIHLEPVPGLADGGRESIDQHIIQLQRGHFQELTRKREYLMKLNQAVEECREMENRALEHVAMDKLVELAYKKKLATRGTNAAKYGLSKVSRPAALGFMKRTLARCRIFEETGKSCFMDPMFKDARENYSVSTVAENRPLPQNSQQEYALPGSFPCREINVLGNSDHPSNLICAMTESVPNVGKREVPLDDVGASASLQPASALGNSSMGGAQGKRSGRQKDKDTSGRSSVKKGGRSSVRRVRKTKAKGKPKEAQPSTSAKGSIGKLAENTNSEHQLACGPPDQLVSADVSTDNRESKVGSVPHGPSSNDFAVETEEPLDLTNIPELDSIELGADKDLDSWLNIDVDALQDDDAVGLDIPMDDLSMVL